MPVKENIKKIALPLKRVDGQSYLDQTKFPKVVTEGYEREFKLDYGEQIVKMFKHLTTKMNELIN